jgi:hypothetical protein
MEKLNFKGDYLDLLDIKKTKGKIIGCLQQVRVP